MSTNEKALRRSWEAQDWRRTASLPATTVSEHDTVLSSSTTILTTMRRSKRESQYAGARLNIIQYASEDDQTPRDFRSRRGVRRAWSYFRYSKTAEKVPLELFDENLLWEDNALDTCSWMWDRPNNTKLFIASMLTVRRSFTTVLTAWRREAKANGNEKSSQKVHRTIQYWILLSRSP